MIAVECPADAPGCETCAQDADTTADCGLSCLIAEDRCDVSERVCSHHCDCWWNADGCCWCHRRFTLASSFGGGS